MILHTPRIYILVCLLFRLSVVRVETKNSLYIFNVTAVLSSLRTETLIKRLNIQRRLAWSLSKNDTHNRREAFLFWELV